MARCKRCGSDLVLSKKAEGFLRLHGWFCPNCEPDKADVGAKQWNNPEGCRPLPGYMHEAAYWMVIL